MTANKKAGENSKQNLNASTFNNCDKANDNIIDNIADTIDINKTIEIAIKKFVGALSLCKKAGKIIYGFDSVQKAVLFENVKNVYLAKDLSDKTKKNMIFFCNQNNIDSICTDFTMDEFHYMVGRKTGIVSINDIGLSKKAFEHYEKIIALKQK